MLKDVKGVIKLVQQVGVLKERCGAFAIQSKMYEQRSGLMEGLFFKQGDGALALCGEAPWKG